MKISKCTSFLLALLVLVSNVGLAFNVHFCGGKVSGISAVYGIDDSASVQLVPVPKSCCGDHAKKEKSCCDNKVFKVKQKSEVVVKAFSFQIDAPFLTSNFQPTIFIPISQTNSNQTTVYYCDAHAPPLYELFSQRLFYA